MTTSVNVGNRRADLVRAHLEIVLGEGHDFVAVLLYDWRRLTPGLRGRVRVLRHRDDQLWQDVASELSVAGLLRNDSIMRPITDYIRAT